VGQTLTFIGALAFSQTGIGELRYAFGTANTIISGDVNGDGKTDFSIELKGQLALQETDFVL
jgi:hypothetical protein